MEFRLLGPLALHDGAAPVDLGARRQRALLARLLLDAGRTVAVERLVDDLWGEDVPGSAVKMVQIYVSQLRKVLPAGTLATRAPGYVLELGGHSLDLHAFERLRREGAAQSAAGDHAGAAAALRSALALWRGAALAEFTEPFAVIERASLEEAHLAVLEDRIDADLALGRHAALVGELEALVARHPLRERLRGQLMLALYRSRRHGEALAAYQAFRRALDEQLAIEPSSELRALELRMLRQDPELGGAAPPSPALPATTPSAPRARAPVPAPVGRARELSALREAVDGARAGERRVVFVTGEAGIGKTTLVEALIADAAARDVVVARGQCIEHHGPGEAYLPLFDAVGRLARERGDGLVGRLIAERAPVWLAQMPWLASPEQLATLPARTAGATPERMLREMVDALEGLAAGEPLLLVLEDLHWSDYSTVDLVSALARRRDPSHLLMVATHRPADAEAAGHPVHRVARELAARGLADELALGPLQEADVAAYLGARGAGALAPAAALRLGARTRGNPLFIEKVIDAWLADGPVDPAADLDGLLGDVPETLRHLVEQQLRGVDADELAALEAAGAAGVEVAAAAVAAALERGDEDAEAILERLSRRGAFLEALDPEEWPDGTLTSRYRFRHDICQEVLHLRIRAPRRSMLHRRIGVRLERAYGDRAAEVAALLASHFVSGRDAERALHHLHVSAVQAFGRGSPRDALEQVRRGLPLLDGLEEPGRARAELALRTIEGPARIALEGWADPEAERTFLRARALCEHLGELEELQWALFKLATFYEVRGDYRLAEDALTESLSLSVVPRTVGVLIDTHELMACTLFHKGDFERALGHADQALSFDDGSYWNVLTAAYGDNPPVAAHSWAALSLWFLGFPDRATERAEAALRLAEDPTRARGRATSLAMAASVAQLRREPERVRVLAGAAVEAGLAHGYSFRVAQGRMLRGWASAVRGDADGGIAEMDAALALARGAGVRMEDPYFLALRAEGCAHAGRCDEGLAAVAEALTHCSGGRTHYYEPELHRLRGVLLAGTGERAGAVAAFERGLESARTAGSRMLTLRAAVSLARAWRREGRGAEARTLVAEARAPVAEGFDTPDVQDADALLEALERDARPVAAEG